MQTTINNKKSPLIVAACVLVAMTMMSLSSFAGSAARPTLGTPDLPPRGPDKHTGQDTVGSPDDGLPCAADATGDQVVNVDDVVHVIMNWGPCGGIPCPGDVDGSGAIDVDDLVDVLLAWGTCP
ncbi:MAG: hypothetical protein ACYTGG_13235 [Planctomycetota bacterium]